MVDFDKIQQFGRICPAQFSQHVPAVGIDGVCNY